MAGNIITCFSAGNSEYKDITLPTATATSPDRIVVRFQNANEYGETTIASPTHPKLRVYNSEETLLKTAEICDSTGHYAGKGCFDDDDIMEFMLVDDNDETLALIKNSDIREKTENYIIKSDGYIIQPDKPDYANPKTITGDTWTTDERVYVCYTAFGNSDYVLKLNGSRISTRTESGDHYINDFNGIIEAGQELNSSYLSTAMVTRIYPLTF